MSSKQIPFMYSVLSLAELDFYTHCDWGIQPAYHIIGFSRRRFRSLLLRIRGPIDMKNMNLQVINAQLLPIFVIVHLRAIGNGLFINILFYNQFVVSFESRSFYYFINTMTSYDTRYLNRRGKQITMTTVLIGPLRDFFSRREVVSKSNSSKGDKRQILSLTASSRTYSPFHPYPFCHC